MPLDVHQIALALGIERSDAQSLYEDLEHIAKSLRGKGRVLLMIPPTCKSCGYVFRDLSKPKRPSKCPKCRSERITNPQFIIEK